MRKISAFVVLLYIFSSLAFAQQATSEIGGRIIDETGAVIPGASVSIVNQETGTFARQAVTGDDGSYLFVALRPGIYMLTVEVPGFKKAVRDDVRLTVGQRQTLDIVLELGQITEIVTVSGATTTVETTSKEVGGEVEHHEVIELPSVNRNFIGFIGLLPGVLPNISDESFGSDSVSVNGQDSRNANFLVDGLSNNDDVIGQRAGGQTRIALEIVEEFQVVTSQFDAQFGKSSGGIINAITKSGTNQLHGSFGGFFMDESFDANSFFNNANGLDKPAASQQQWFATLGGPIWPDVAHFFASIEHVSIDEAVSVNIPARPELNDATSETTKSLNTLIKGDFQLADDHHLSLRWIRESSPQFNQIIGAVTTRASRQESDVDQTIVGNLTSTFGSHYVNEFRFGLTRENVTFGNPCFIGGGSQADCPPTLDFQTFTDQQNNVAQGRINNSWQAEEVGSLFLSGLNGEHNITFGGQYNYVTGDNFNEGSLNGTFSFPFDLAFDPNDPMTFPNLLTFRVGGPSLFVVVNHNIGLFVQDKWQIHPDLSLSLGLRWDKETITDDNNNFGPRVGFAWNVNGDNKTVLRGGFGVFYDKTTFSLVGLFESDGPFAESFLRNFPLNSTDPGPENGMFPTDPTLVNGPFIDLEVINSIVGTGALSLNTTPTFENDQRGVPGVRTYSIGIQRELLKDIVVQADYIHSDGFDQLVTIDQNPGFRADGPETFNTILRPDQTLGRVRTFINAGKTDFDSLQLQLSKRFNGSYSFRGSYSLGHARGTTSSNQFSDANFQQGEELNLDLNQGRSDFDRRHNFVFSGTWKVPGTGGYGAFDGLLASVVFRAVSGQPFTLQNTRFDADQNGINFDPLPSGTFSGRGRNAITLRNEGERNGASGPAFYNADLRLQYKFKVGETISAAASFETFNLFNRANFNNPSGNFANFDPNGVPNINFLNLTSTSFPRMLQLGFRVEF